ncbi:MAG TPA: M64 family metallopeptidase, partial [Candidatus Nitrosotenuis sp.]|nr:M64 family metallopeptidase [Candidatus Nitrosotenuis sp.]
EGPGTGPDLYEEVLYDDRSLPEAARRHLETHPPGAAQVWPGSEVRTLVSQGPRENRINLTIVGDGYTEAEKDRFFEDARRLTEELFRGPTFASYLPLFNVHAVFVPSRESGISDEVEKDTALGLYRYPAGSKRAIFPGKPDAIERALDLAPATDFPILVANDDFYGGLGGRYAITTRSPESGAMVLRHELGHNFGDVGEEYDGGSVYSGANHSDGPDVPWRHWVEGEPRVFEARHLLGQYPWKNLEQGPAAYRVQVPESTDKVVIDLSSVGWATPQDVALTVDGQEIPYQGLPTRDRSFHRAQLRLEPGRHRLEVRENIHDHDNVLALVNVNAYPPDYDFTPGKVAAFPTFSGWGGLAGYRPTHEDCLMRDMRSTRFCPVDQENMWHQFLNRISLIDGVRTGSEGDPPRPFVQLDAPALDGLDIRWFRLDDQGGEVERPDLRGLRRWNPAPGEAGRYRVRVSFSTPEVRRYTERFRAQQDIEI